MVHGAHNGHALVSQAVPHGEQGFMAIDSEGDVLHSAGCGVSARITGMGLTNGCGNGFHFRVADKGDRALIVQS